MRLLWCHLQSHYFKETKGPRCHQHKEQMYPPTSSVVPLCLNDNSPAEALMRARSLVKVLLGFDLLALIVHQLYNDISSSHIVTWKKLLVCANSCTLMCFLYVCVPEVVCAENLLEPSGCPPSKGSHKICSQAGYDMMRQGDNKTTTLVHG